MPEKNYTILIDEENEIFVYFETVQGVVTAFVVKYITIIEDESYEVLRFDSAHETPHVDILDPDGNTRQKVWLTHLDNGAALDYAQEDIKQHYQSYRERFIQWRNDVRQ
jgi:hypothetical protein